MYLCIYVCVVCFPQNGVPTYLHRAFSKLDRDQPRTTSGNINWKQTKKPRIANNLGQPVLSLMRRKKAERKYHVNDLRLVQPVRNASFFGETCRCSI